MSTTTAVVAEPASATDTPQPRFGPPVIGPDSPISQAFAKAMNPPGATPSPADQTPPPPAPPATAPSKPKKTFAELLVPKKEPPKVEPQPDEKTPDPDMPAEIKSDEGRKSWKTWKAKHNDLVKERDALQSQHAAAVKQMAELEDRLKAINPEETAKLRAERDELHTRLKLKDVTSLPEWQERFERPVNTAIERAKRAVPAEQQARLEALLRLPPSETRDDAVQELIGDLPPLKQSLVSTALATVDETVAAKADAMKDEKALVAGYEKWLEQENLKTATAAKEQRERMASHAFDAALKQAVESIPLFQMLNQGSEEEKAIAAEAVTEARKLAGTINGPESVAALALAAVNGAKSQAVIVEAIAEIERLQGELDRLQSASPKTTGDAGGKPSGPQNFMEAFKAAMGGG